MGVVPIPRCFEVQKGFLGVCSKSVSGCVVLEAFSSRARFICTTVVQIGVALLTVSRKLQPSFFRICIPCPHFSICFSESCIFIGTLQLVYTLV